MSLPLFQSDNKTLNLLQTRWKSEIDPVLINPFTNGILINGIVLINGATIINHLLARRMQGWVIVDQNAQARIYRSQPLSNTTLTLTSDAACTISLWAF